VDKVLKEQERLAYIDPEKSLEEKQKGNDAFTKGLYCCSSRHQTQQSLERVLCGDTMIDLGLVVILAH